MGKAQADVIVARLATRTRNLVTRSNLREAGLTDRQIDSRIKTEQLTAVHRGVFLLGGGEPDFEQRCLAAALASEGWISHRAAAALFDLRRMEREHVDVTVTGRRRALSLAGVSAHWTGKLEDSECTSVSGIPVTAPARTLLDVAGLVPPAVLEGALDDALVRRLTHLPEIERMLQGLGGRGHPGIARFRRLVSERVGGQRPTESPLEDELFALIRRFGLPEPVRQFPLRLPSGRQTRRTAPTRSALSISRRTGGATTAAIPAGEPTANGTASARRRDGPCSASQQRTSVSIPGRLPTSSPRLSTLPFAGYPPPGWEKRERKGTVERREARRGG